MGVLVPEGDEKGWGSLPVLTSEEVGKGWWMVR